MSKERWAELLESICCQAPDDRHGPPLLEKLLAHIGRTLSPIQALEEILYRSDYLSSQEDQQQMYKLLLDALEPLPDDDQKKEIRTGIKGRMSA